MTTLKLGTRRSLLAWAQSSWVAREVERLNPGLSVELVGIDTRGDQILDVSLSNVDGKEFFVAELDAALKSGLVDFTVHSMKDLSLTRPPEFCLGAIPRRENPRDAILYGPGVLEKIRVGKVLKIGTSSPRRLENIPGLLRRILPRFEGQTPKVDLVEIRGNVNTRLGRVHERPESEKHLDGVVLAFAGLIRLWADSKARDEMIKLFQGVRWMILPLAECPTAPAQGALAVECRTDRDEVRAALKPLHHEATASDVETERALLGLWGGGCHQKFGATAIRHSELGQLFWIRGRKPDEVFVEELRWPLKPTGNGKSNPLKSVWDGTRWRGRQVEKIKISVTPTLSGNLVFISHARALPENWVEKLVGSRVWTSGVASWEKLASQGVWVEGCAEGLGYDELIPTLREQVLGLGTESEWMVLTHESAGGWSKEKVIRTYSVPSEISREGLDELKKAHHIFWSSGSQFDHFGKYAAAKVVHACGPGKTGIRLRVAGLKPLMFPSVEEWRKWVS
ncbi:MAG: hydroxymethylbilane synthase [Bdellovibrionota bacterium]